MDRGAEGSGRRRWRGFAAELVGGSVGLVATAVLLVWSVGLSISWFGASAVKMSEDDENTIRSALSSWRPADVPLLEETSIKLRADGCDAGGVWRWKPNSVALHVYRVPCADPLAAFRAIRGYHGVWRGFGAGPRRGEPGLVTDDPRFARVVWRERNVVVLATLNCPGRSGCVDVLLGYVADLQGLGGEGGRHDPQADAAMDYLVLPLTSWLVLVAPVRLWSVVRRQRFVAAGPAPWVVDISSQLAIEHWRRWGAGVLRVVAVVFGLVAVVGVGMVFENVVFGVVELVLGTSVAVTAGWAATRVRPGRSVRRTQLWRQHGAAAWWGSCLMSTGRMIGAGAVAAFVWTALLAAVFSQVSLDEVLNGLLDHEADGRPLSVFKWSMLWLAAGNRSNMELTVLLGTLPALALAYLVRWWGARLRAAGARELVAADDRAPVLFLRSFDEDSSRIAAPMLRRGLIERILPWRRRSFEQLLAAALAPFGPVVAVSDPRHRLRSLGAAKLELPHDAWTAEVARLAAGARVVVMAATPAEARAGLQTELEMLARDPGVRLIVVRGPYKRADGNRRWWAWLQAAARWPLFRPLAGGWVPEGMLLASHDPVHGWRAWTCRVRTDRSYELAIRSALAPE